MPPVESLGQALHDAAHETEPNVVAAVHGGLDRGRRMRRNRRIAQVAGSTAAIVAVGAVSVFAAGGTPNQHAASVTGAGEPTPHKTPPKYPLMASSDKVLDIRMHLPALLQQMLPSGTTVAAAPKEWTTFGGAVFVVSNATGASEVHVTAMPLYDTTDTTKFADEFCGTTSHSAKKPCTTRKVPGGTIYIANEDKTAADDSGGTAPAGVYQPGHENDFVWQGQRLTFVPDDHSQSFFQIQETTQVAAVPYANTAPAGSKYYQWPPTNNDIKGAVGTGVTISPDDFAAMVGKPQISRIEQLLDTSVPASQSAIVEGDAINAQIARLVGPVLPTGVKITVNYTEGAGGFLVLTGPTGVNGLEWYTNKHSHGLLATNNLKCAPEDSHCEMRKVPGATVQWNNQFENSQKGFAGFEYVPDDANGNEVAIMLSPQDPTSGLQMPESTTKTATPQLTYDQMLAIVTNPSIADIMKETTLLGK
jgi:hypothetical protein